jgi:hypothetical protein
MRNVFTIIGKELRSYFVSPVAYVVLLPTLSLRVFSSSVGGFSLTSSHVSIYS